MSRELIRDLDATTVIRANAGKPTLDAEAFKKFLTVKSVPPATIDDLTAKIQERMKRASDFSGNVVPGRVIEWCKGQMNQELDALVLASDAMRGTSIRATTAAAVADAQPVAPQPRPAVTDKPAAPASAPNRIAQNLMGNTARINTIVDGTK